MINGILPFQMNGSHFRCEVKYDETKPYELAFVFRQLCGEGDCTDLHETPWVIGRDLLSEGLNSEAWVGLGDVSIRRDSDKTIQCVLRTHQGNSTLTIPRRPLKDFLTLTYDLVNAGDEHEQLDWNQFDELRVSW